MHHGLFSTFGWPPKMLIFRKSSIHFSRIFLEVGLHTQEVRRLCSRDLGFAKGRCASLIWLLCADTSRSFKVCQATQIHNSSRQSVKQSSLYGFFLLFPDGTRSNPTTKELKIDSKSHQQWNIRAKLFVSLLILLQLLKKFCCSTRRCFFLAAVSFWALHSDCHLAARVVFPSASLLVEFFRDGVLKASWSSCVKDSLFRLCQVWTKKDYICVQFFVCSQLFEVTTQT